ncbi:MAG: YeiH family protein [Pleomorphochaeta sp.]
MNFIKENLKGFILAILIATPAFIIGAKFPLIGGPILAIIFGMILNPLVKDKSSYEKGIRFTSKKILQYAVILLGFGLNLNVVLETGKQSLPIIVSTITTSLLIAYFLSKAFKIDSKIATLVGVGSSICGGSAIAATTSVINADDDEVATALSVIFFFNVLAAIIFPQLGVLLNFSTESGNAFGIFAGTAINDTSSVTAAASTWDSMFNLSTQTLDKAVTVKLTRTLAIIPITLVLAFIQTKKTKTTEIYNWKKIFPLFIIYFIIASLITTILTNFGVDQSVFSPFKTLSKFFIIMAMGAIGFNTNLVKLIKKGGKPIFLGFTCWIGITIVSLFMQHALNIW